MGETADVMLPARESCDERLDVFGVLDLLESVNGVGLTVVVVSGEVFFGEYHWGRSFVGNADDVVDDDCCVEMVEVIFCSKEETDDDVPLSAEPVSGLTGAGGGGCDGGPLVATGFGASGMSLLPPKMLPSPLIEPPLCCFFF